MEVRRFDALTRALAVATSRRQVLRALVAGAAGGLPRPLSIVAAAQVADEPGESAAAGSLIAYRQDHDVWLMEADGTGKRAVTGDGGDPLAGSGESPAGEPGRDYRWFGWSPDGRHLAIVASIPIAPGTDPTGQGGLELLVYPPADAAPRPLLSGVAGVPSWSRDGRLIATALAGPSTADAPLATEIAVLDLATGTVRTLASADPSVALGPAWAVDADEVAYASAGTSTEGETPFSVFAVDLDGAIAELPGYEAWVYCHSQGGEGGDPAWVRYHVDELEEYPDLAIAPQIQWSRAAGLAIYNALCAGGAFVADLEADTTARMETAWEGVLSATGRIAVSLRGATPQVGIVDPKSGAVTVVGDGELPAWSADGQALYFVRRVLVEELPPLGYAEAPTGSVQIQLFATSLWRAGADGAQPTQLIELDAYGFGPPSPTPDGRAVVFACVDNATALWEHRLAGDRLDETLLERYGPETRVLRLDLATGQAATLARRAGRPRVQPRAAAPAPVPAAAAAPRITAGPEAEAAAGGVVITWVTDLPATSVVEYGPTAAYGARVEDAAPVVEHRLEVTGLAPGQTYHFRVRSAADGGEVTSADNRTFTVPAPAGGDYLIAVTEGGNVALVGADGTGKRTITSVPPPADDEAAAFFDAPRPSPACSWSPGGRYLAIALSDDPLRPYQRSLALYDAVADELRPLPSDLGVVVSWSPSGRYLVTTRLTSADAEHPATFDVVVFDTGSEELTTLATDVPISLRPTWAMDVDEVAFGVWQGSPGDPITAGHTAVSRIALDGAPVPMPGFEAISDCFEGPPANYDPCYPLYQREATFFANPAVLPPLQWSLTHGLAVYQRPCAGAFLADLGTGATRDLEAAWAVLAPSGRLVVRTHGELVLVEPGADAGQPLGDGELPAWSADGAVVYFVRRTLVEEFAHWPDSASGSPGLEIKRYRSAVWRANANGSGLAQVAELDAYGLGPLQPTADGRALVFSAVENAMALWEHVLANDAYDAELLARHGPRVNVHRLDLATGAVQTLVRDAGRPAVQPPGDPMLRPDNGDAGGDQAEPGGGATAEAADSETDGLPADYLGTWSGTGVQDNPPVSWPIAVSLTGGGVGDVVGTVAYPSLGCSGDLTLLRAAPSSQEFGEDITAGEDACIDGGTFRLTLTSDGGLDFAWASPDGGAGATGRLTRAGSSGATAAGEPGDERPLAELLPTAADVPGGLVVVDEGERTAAAITASFPDPAEAASRFVEWDWHQSVYRTFGLPEGTAAAPGQTITVDAGIYLFGQAAGAAAALPYLADARAVALGLAERPLAPLGDQARALGGWVGEALEASVYVQFGARVLRVTASSLGGDPLPDAEAVAVAVLAK